jgi:hypothetical protein
MVEKRLLCSMGLREKIGVASNKEALFIPSRGGGLGAGVYVTRSEQKAAWYSGKHFTNGVIIKLKVALGRYVEINGQGHPLQMTWMEHGYDSAFAPAGAIGVREENCIADPFHALK